MPRRPATIDACQLCERRCALTFHHLIPRKLHRRTRFRKHYSRSELAAGVWLCRLCHSGLHRLYDEMTLAREFAALERLQADVAISRHVGWVRKQAVAAPEQR